jgi:hypothetical protein
MYTYYTYLITSIEFRALNVIIFSFFSLVAGVVDRGIVTEKLNGKKKKIKKLIKKLKKKKKIVIVRKKIKRKDNLINRHLVKKKLRIV